MNPAARAGAMRLLFAIFGAMALAQCVTAEERRFHVGESASAFVIIGLAEAADNTSARYTQMWRLLDAGGAFTEHSGRTTFEPETNTGDSIRVRGIPGEFFAYELEPGAYALDSVFGVIRDDRINYTAAGLITGPERPAFEIRPGEAIYLGIWQADIDVDSAVTRLWRLDEADIRAVLAQEDRLVVGDVRLRETHERAVACAPRRLNNISLRQIC
jgi:hypothetical protein